MLLQMKCDVWKPCSDLRWQDKLLFSIWRFFEQSAFVNHHLLCTWPTIHTSIPKFCPKFQVISSHFCKVIELLNEHWAKIVWSKINQRFAFKNSCFLRLALIFNLNYPRATVLYTKNWLQVAKFDKGCTVFFGRLIQTYCIVVKVSSRELGDIGSIPD